MNNKYFIDENKYKILDDGVVVYRIRSRRSFFTKSGFVEEGEYGGYVQSEENLSKNRTCWIYGDSVVRDNARVCGEAVVFDSVIDKSAVLSDLCLVASSYITDYAVISGKTSVLDSIVSGNAIVSGPTRLYKSHISGNACVFEKEMLERATIDSCVGSFVKSEENAIRCRTHKYSLIPLLGEYEGLFRLLANEELVNYCGKTTEKVIPAGTLGGIVSSARNISQYGDCWIDYDSMVLGDASVHDYAYVTGGSILCGNAVACGSAYVSGSQLSDNAYVAGRAKIFNVVLGGKSRVFGTAEIGSMDTEKSNFVGKLACENVILASIRDSKSYNETVSSQNFD